VQNVKLKKIALTAMLSAFSLIAFMLEHLLPPLILPGAKIGFANVFVLLALIILGEKSAFSVVIIKSVLGSIFSGNVSAILYSLPSGIIALIFETILLYRAEKFSVISVSVLGAVITSIIQNVIFCLMTNAIEYLTYLPYLALTGVIAGAIVGLTVFAVVKFFPQNLLNGILKEKKVDSKR
jgi:heptaprenyl diphosphate synthase